MERQEFNKELMKLKKLDLIEYFWKKIDKDEETSNFHIEKSKRFGKKILELNNIINSLNKVIKQQNIYIHKNNDINADVGRKCIIFEVSDRGLQRSYTGVIKKETEDFYEIKVKDSLERKWSYSIKKINITGIKWFT